MRQETINTLLVRAARRGKRVVRLKGGDPFVFGRGGEEALALLAAGVAFEVVPGVSSALAAPALSGIPVTHRGLASAFVVVSGHADSAWRPVLAGLRPGGATVVALMALRARREIAAELLGRGWAGTTPAAILWSAGTQSASRWVGTLAELDAVATPEDALGDPGTLVVGAVVGLSKALGGTHARESEEEERPRSERAAVTGGQHAR
jgi:siroheme synthase